MELHKRYEDVGGKVRLRLSLINYLSEAFHPDLLVLSSPGNKSSTTFRIVEDAGDDCSSQAESSLGRTRCHAIAKMTARCAL